MKKVIKVFVLKNENAEQSFVSMKQAVSAKTTLEKFGVESEIEIVKKEIDL